jgi:hypothetical protein
MSTPNDWDAKKDLQLLIERMRDRGMHNNPHLREARECLAAELARRKGDWKTFNRIVGFAAGNSSVNGDYGGGGPSGDHKNGH